MVMVLKDKKFINTIHSIIHSIMTSNNVNVRRVQKTKKGQCTITIPLALVEALHIDRGMPVKFEIGDIEGSFDPDVLLVLRKVR